jgi:TPR repeat protein/predicted Ser/Thr protein kinase
MTSAVERCSNCGKEKRSRKLGSFTQWILDQNHCDCDKISEQVAAAPKMEYCSICGKPLPTGRHGSMTQWIFSGSTCSCERPGRVVPPQGHASIQAHAPIEEIQEDEAELSVDARQFPSQRYKALSVLGQGGAGKVYLCRDRLLGIKVAVKTLRQLNNEQLIAFQTEARATSSLNHPLILRMLDFGPTESGSPYMVMEYFNGIPLDQWIEEHGLFQPLQTVHIFERIASALSKAHQLGIFHRDLKPSNILIAVDSAEMIDLKLIDFGVAIVEQETHPSPTAQGRTLAGTPTYMPPDIVLGRSFDQRSEIYSLGCVLYECLAGRPPFIADSALELMKMHADAPVPTFLEIKKTVKPELEKVVLKCLEKNPEDRYSSMDELACALNSIASEPETKLDDSPAPTRLLAGNKRPNHPRKVIFIGVGCLMLLAFSSYPLIKQSPSTKKEKSKKTVPVPEEKALTKISDHAPPQMSETLAKASDNLRSLEMRASNGDVGAQWKLAIMYSRGDGVPLDQETAFKYALKAAKGNNADAQNMLAYMYEDGQGVERSEKDAFYWFKRAAANGNVPALSALGRMYRGGIGTKKDDQKALLCFQQAIARGSTTAKANLAQMYEDGNGVPQDYAKAMTLFRQASAEGDPAAENNVGFLYLHGCGVPVNYEEAFKHFEASAKRGCIEAHSNLAKLYKEGLGVPQSYEQTIKHLKYAADHGEVNAINNLGLLYMSGEGGQEKIAEAIPLFHRAIKLGSYLAMSNLGQMHERGLATKRDIKEALRLYTISAEHGERYGQNSLGNLYKDGIGVERDYKSAVNWYQRAADQNLPVAQNNLGTMYMNGWGVKKDYQKAIHWLSTAAENGNALAYCNLATLYENGQGVNRDYKRAFSLYAKAAGNGVPHAKFHIARMFETGSGVNKNLEAAERWYAKAASSGLADAELKVKELRRLKEKPSK